MGLSVGPSRVDTQCEPEGRKVRRCPEIMFGESTSSRLVRSIRNYSVNSRFYQSGTTIELLGSAGFNYSLMSDFGVRMKGVV